MSHAATRSTPETARRQPDAGRRRPSSAPFCANNLQHHGAGAEAAHHIWGEAGFAHGLRAPVYIHNPKGGAPRGNRNAHKHGRYSHKTRERRAGIRRLLAEARALTRAVGDLLALRRVVLAAAARAAAAGAVLPDWDRPLQDFTLEGARCHLLAALAGIEAAGRAAQNAAPKPALNAARRGPYSSHGHSQDRPHGPSRSCPPGGARGRPHGPGDPRAGLRHGRDHGRRQWRRAGRARRSMCRCGVVVFQAPAERSDPGLAEEEKFEHTAPLTVLINPNYEIVGREPEGGWEGCLSVPGLRGYVERAAHIRYRGLDLAGHKVEREAKGFHARVVQHELDHLDGMLYPQRMSDLSKLIFESEVKHWLAREGGQ